MFDKLVKEKGLVAAIAVIVLQFSIIVLASIVTFSMLKVILLTLICVMCIAILRKVLFIKVK